MDSKQAEKFAITKLAEYLLNISGVDPKLNFDDTGISWDGEIDLYNGNTTSKKNYCCSIKTQVKGRKANTKKFNSKINYNVNVEDLKNYLKEDGTLYIVVKYKNNNEFRIYYATLLPYDLRKYLKQTPNNKNEISIRMREIPSYNSFERILRNFNIDRNEQKKISENIFSKGGVSYNKNGNWKFYDCRMGDNIFDLVNDLKYAYEYDDNNNIINIDTITLTNIEKTKDGIVKNKNGDTYYTDIIISFDGEEKMYFGNRGFYFNFSQNNFNIRISGTLLERIKQIEFIEDIVNDGGFYIDENFIVFNETDKMKKCFSIKKIYDKIYNFLKKRKIEKEINLDEWSDLELNRLLFYIDLYESKKSVKLKSDISYIGYVGIKELNVSTIAIKKNDNEFTLYNIWNDPNLPKLHFKYNDGVKDIFTNSIFLVLNKQTYCSDDIDFEVMKKEIAKISLSNNKQALINLQALEVIRAYDETKNEELLNYAEYLLSKIEKYDELKEIVFVNQMQIKKRKNELSIEDKEALYNLKKTKDDLFFELSIDLLLDNKEEAKMLFNKLDSDAQQAFCELPLYWFLTN